MGILRTKEVDAEYLKRASKSVHITAVFVVMVSMKYEISWLGWETHFSELSVIGFD